MVWQLKLHDSKYLSLPALCRRYRAGARLSNRDRRRRVAARSRSYEAVVSSPRGSYRRGVLLASVNYAVVLHLH